METDFQTQERTRLRAKYIQAVSDLTKTLKSQPQAAYRSDELDVLRVSLGSFDPNDQKFLDSSACLFKPLSSRESEKYTLVESDFDEIGLRSYKRFDEAYDSVTKEKGVTNPSPGYIMSKRANLISSHLDFLYYHSRKKIRKNLVSFYEVSGWVHIKYGNSFLDGARGLLSGDLIGLPYRLPDWRTVHMREWWKDEDASAPAYPHMMLIICSGAEAKENELLIGELGPIAQAIENRLEQAEFEETSLFPIMAISLFGPRHGRLLQAKFNKSGVLKIRASPIYSFRYKAEAPFDLFLRYLACEPRHGAEYEFYSDEEDAPMAPEYVSPPPGADKENVSPKQGDTPSAEEQ